jgi:hypothetical protein
MGSGRATIIKNGDLIGFEIEIALLRDERMIRNGHWAACFAVSKMASRRPSFS